MQRPVLGEALWVALAPGQRALRVVDASLIHRRARKPGDVTRSADVVRVHVRHHDRLDRCVERVEDRPPALLGVARPEPGVDEDEAARRADEIAVHVVDAERQREGDAIEPLLDLHHA
jgi:hypothetical protein